MDYAKIEERAHYLIKRAPLLINMAQLTRTKRGINKNKYNNTNKANK